MPSSTPLPCVDIFSTKFRSRTARSPNSCRCDRRVARCEHTSLLKSKEHIPFDICAVTGFGSAAFFLWTVRIPSCGSVYAVALFSWISSCSSVGCENIRQETSAAGSLRSSVHLAAQPPHVPPSCVSALRSSVDRVRCEQVDATRREHGYYPASSLRVALLRLNTPDSTSSGPLC